MKTQLIGSNVKELLKKKQFKQFNVKTQGESLRIRNSCLHLFSKVMFSHCAVCVPRLISSWFLENLSSTCEGGEAIDGSEDGGEDVAEDDTEECGSGRG